MKDHKGVSDWFFAQPLEWRRGVQVVAIDLLPRSGKHLRTWIARTAVAVEHFHLVSLGNPAMTNDQAKPVR